MNGQQLGGRISTVSFLECCGKSGHTQYLRHAEIGELSLEAVIRNNNIVLRAAETWY